MSPRLEYRPAGLEHLLAALRAAGLPVGAHEILRLHSVFALAPSLGQDRPVPEQLRDLLAAALTHDPAERRLFDDVYEPWAERWDKWARRRGAERPGKLEPSLQDFQPALAPARRQRRSRLWSVAVRMVSLALLAVILGHSSGDKVERRKNGGVPPPGVKAVHEIWVSPSVLETKAVWRPDWPLLSLSALAVLAAALLSWRYRNKSWIPEVLADSLPGPLRLPLLPLPAGGPELLDAGSAETLIWGVDRHVTERFTTELDLEATARETARAGGIPELRFEPEKRMREVWLWLDGTVEDPGLERWAEEIAGSLERSGLPVRIGGFDGVPDELMWDEGQSLRPVEVEGHRETALVAVCTDGEVLLRQLEDERGASLRPLLSSLAGWQRLAVVDFLHRGEVLAEALAGYGVVVVAPEELPDFFGLGAVRLPKPESVDPGEIRAWRAALALGDRPIDRATAFAVRRALALELSPWTFHRLTQGGADDPTVPKRLGGRLIWSDEGRTTLVAWLAEGSLAEPSGIRSDSVLDRALDFWEARLADEASRRSERAVVEPWNERPAERHLRMEQALLRLWRRPKDAAEELFGLGSGELAKPLESRLGRMTPRDGRRPGDGRIPLPWGYSNLDDRSAYLLAERGFGGLRRGVLNYSGRLGLGLGAMIGVAVLLFATGSLGRLEETSTASGLELVEAQAPPQDERLWAQMSFVELPGGTFRMGSEEAEKTAYFFDEQPAPDAIDAIVGDFWIGRTEVTNAQYRVFKPDHATDDASDLPAANVSWFEARDYCRSLGQSEGWEFDLPTEAEWEYATRAGTTTAWSFGDDQTVLADYAWFRENSGIEAHPVGQKKPNPWGLYDVHGNVWEWVLDCWEDDYRQRARGTPISDPGLEADSCHQSDRPGASRVFRGGAFDDGPRNLRSAVRVGSEPEVSYSVLGFRCVRRARRQL